MAEVAETALANRTKQVILLGCCCHSVVLACDYVQAAAVKPVHSAHHWLSERPRFRCLCQRRTHSKLVYHQLQRARQPVVCPYAGERAECSVCDGHAVTNVGVVSVFSVVSVVSAVTLHYRPQILERVDVLERNVADVRLAQQSLGSTPLWSMHGSIGQRASMWALRHNTITPASGVGLQCSLRWKRSGASVALVCQCHIFNLGLRRWADVRLAVNAIFIERDKFNSPPRDISLDICFAMLYTSPATISSPSVIVLHHDCTRSYSFNIWSKVVGPLRAFTAFPFDFFLV